MISEERRANASPGINTVALGGLQYSHSADLEDLHPDVQYP